MKIQEILWLSHDKFPISFSKETPVLSFERKPEYSKIIVHGILREGRDYRGSIIVFYEGVNDDTLTGRTYSTYQWLDLKTFIKKFGEYKTNV